MKSWMKFKHALQRYKNVQQNAFLFILLLNIFFQYSAFSNGTYKGFYLLKVNTICDVATCTHSGNESCTSTTEKVVNIIDWRAYK